MWIAFLRDRSNTDRTDSRRRIRSGNLAKRLSISFQRCTEDMGYPDPAVIRAIPRAPNMTGGFEGRTDQGPKRFQYLIAGTVGRSRRPFYQWDIKSHPSMIAFILSLFFRRITLSSTQMSEFHPTFKCGGIAHHSD
jgi:hypothetical protein